MYIIYILYTRVHVRDDNKLNMGEFQLKLCLVLVGQHISDYEQRANSFYLILLFFFL